jgi:endoglucanase
LAATAAQCARVFSGVDDTYSATCRTAAEAAYAAAKKHPSSYAVSGDTDEDGGGAYDDDDVSDEFYWAAAELYVTTGKQAYLDDLLASPHHLEWPDNGAPFSWPSTAGLGALTLSIVPSELTGARQNEVRSALLAMADGYVTLTKKGYGTPMENYAWGSNSDVLNAGVVCAVAHDLTGQAAYRGCVQATLDYVLGRNPLGKSYVTGYGSNPFQNAHHRFFAHGFDPSWPSPPPGFVAGGPNVNLDGLSPVGALAGCQGPRCWTDVAAAYGLTEVTVNWNAPLAWVAAWASEQETDPGTSFPGVDGTGGGSSGGSGSAQGGSSSDPAASGGGADGSGAADSGGTQDDPSGCGCAQAGRPSDSTSALALAALLGAGWLVRGRTRAGRSFAE